MDIKHRSGARSYLAGTWSRSSHADDGCGRYRDSRGRRTRSGISNRGVVSTGTVTDSLCKDGIDGRERDSGGWTGSVRFFAVIGSVIAGSRSGGATAIQSIFSTTTVGHGLN